ncbi:ATP-binding protein [Candidatus Viridilinea mediisalina]|uniref:Uncharacterized protein n=1 Tax=Candidatus Viridilinea mediisalina TaxID=2024553 RepID=A0A2A6RI42_9CHLR|nr:ATP-binding protein [Candidatus Viridilinea mediisalina]PDW02613.1 hypothetical protein CJ255_13070 [Candidatus Viridilinea mediisalina]
MSEFTCHQCWKHDRINDVINMEAIAVDIPDFMATHTPLGQIAYLQPSGPIAVSEADLLGELTKSSQADRHMFAIVEGEPGTGKSHLIRWLYERYKDEQAGQDEVLLIERAQNSLLSTLRQIIDRLSLAGDALREQIAKLRGAAESLSARALQDTLINNLAIATYEREASRKPKIRNNIERFLLDALIREQLKAEDGPIERIARFLTVGRRNDDTDQRPEFRPDDFELPTKLLYDLRTQGYQEAKYLAEALSMSLDLRSELAAYLNGLLDYAVTKTVVLSPDDLKQTFNDLRRELRQQRRGLAFFIEDITAFTGIDVGLIDVLATQHTGESNRDFCRIVSIIGITDDYFQSRFPKNLQERVTHHLSLNVAAPGQTGAGLLPNSSAVGGMFGRYLNAMRLERTVVQDWHANGGRTAQLPNGCAGCAWRAPCHSAFGAVDIGTPGNESYVGLYPFNERAAWNIFRRLDHETITKTPRSLLRYVLREVLQRHGSQVKSGAFPPPPKELASGVRDIPPLTKPVHQRIINEQGGSSAQRIQTLVLYWGDGSVDTQGEGTSRTVGGLSDTVYRAFGITPIAGSLAFDTPTMPAVSSELSTLGDLQRPLEPQQVQQIQPDTQRESTATPGVRMPPPRPPAQPRDMGKYTADIANWRGGGQLEHYEKLREWLVTFIKGGIQWELYGIPDLFVKERIENRRFEIEGQSGSVRGDCLFLPRSDELADVLQALVDLNERGQKLAPEDLGAHLATLSTWLHNIEPMVVEFALKPTNTQPAPMRIVELLLLDCLLLEWLCDGLKNDASSLDLLGSVIASAARETGSQPLKEQEWNALVEQAKKRHSPTWASLLRQIGMKRAHSCRRGLARLLSLPQGDSSDVRYIDATLGLQIIAAMGKRDWELLTIPAIDKRAKVIWTDGGAVYQLFAQHMEQVLADERSFLQAKLERLKELAGEAKPEEIMKAVEQLRTTMGRFNKPHSLNEPSFKGPGFKNAQQYLMTTVNQEGRGLTAIRMSAGGRFVEQMETILVYLAEVEKVAKKMLTQTEQQIKQLGADSTATQLEEQTIALYDEIIERLQASSGEPQIEPQEVSS